MLRAILLVHRYTAVAVGVLMTLWCLSGFVMMYQAYPALTEAERLRGLERLELAGCCELGGLNADGAAPAPEFRVEMLGGAPILRLGPGPPRAGLHTHSGIWNLRSDRPLHELSPAELREVASRYGQAHELGSEPRPVGTIEMDQWTVQNARRNRPVHHFAFDDRAATEIYVSGASGEVFQDTNRRERVLAWLGAIPHWLYPLELRRNGALWTEIVIWTSVIGTFLAATGIYVGIMRWSRARQRERWSLYRGWWFWHHMSGLVFGVLVLSWVFSGLMTMNPWGTLSGGEDYGRRINGGGTWDEVARFLSAAGAGLAGGDFVQLESAPFDDRLYVTATRSDGSRVRLDAYAQPAPLERAEVRSALEKLPAAIRELELMKSEDSFYYGHKTTVDLPVYRALLDDAERTRLYVNPTTGAVRSVGATRRVSRWIRTGLHDLDFGWMRTRPIWDLVVLPLLAGVTLVCATGTWMALKRIRHDLRRLRRRFSRSRVVRPPRHPA